MTGFSYSTAGFVDRDIEAALDAIAAAGFKQSEICVQPPQGKELRGFRSRLESRGLARGTVHAPMRRNVLGAPE